ncbi:hypothetical protein BDA99DRAFT_538212 [Phascolomyces articulosus]|uniref:Uncharacterized protein n=1 Tax=Phascolomyces articulosus TaxID=60185 RepID=A0AAD5K821_9FUNG|nr:hypothetical protein BDA99DRAFT_538212 [Phascolomyces articulosus]
MSKTSSLQQLVYFWPLLESKSFSYLNFGILFIINIYVDEAGVYLVMSLNAEGYHILLLFVIKSINYISYIHAIFIDDDDDVLEEWKMGAHFQTFHWYLEHVRKNNASSKTFYADCEKLIECLMHKKLWPHLFHPHSNIKNSCSI